MQQFVVIASDHAGIGLKDKVVKLLGELGIQVEDLGPASRETVDYPDYGALVAEAVSTGRAERGVLVCGTGIGMTIVANKFPGVRAALCHDAEAARMGREHTDANLLVLGERVLPEARLAEIVRTWLETPFAGGRHAGRLDKVRAIEKKTMRSPRHHKVPKARAKGQELKE